MNRTIKLNEITFGVKSNFTWGEAIKHHSIGEYDIVEFYPHEYKDCCATGKIDYSDKEFSCYINQESIGRSTDSLDSALACCIAYKHEGMNTRAGDYFMKMISSLY